MSLEGEGEGGGEEMSTSMSTPVEVGRRSGTTMRNKYGEDYYRRIGKIGGFTKRLDREIYVADETSATPLRNYALQSRFYPLPFL